MAGGLARPGSGLRPAVERLGGRQGDFGTAQVCAGLNDLVAEHHLDPSGLFLCGKAFLFSLAVAENRTAAKGKHKDATNGEARVLSLVHSC